MRLLLIAVSLASAHWLAPRDAAWPLLDSLTTGFSLLATWLAARAKLENWLYWIVINGVMVFLFFAQKVWGMAWLSLILMGIAAAGFIAWRRKYQAQEVPA
jgi:nicotinamide mononucleotide transporter